MGYVTFSWLSEDELGHGLAKHSLRIILVQATGLSYMGERGLFANGKALGYLVLFNSLKTDQAIVLQGVSVARSKHHKQV